MLHIRIDFRMRISKAKEYPDCKFTQETNKQTNQLQTVGETCGLQFLCW